MDYVKIRVGIVFESRLFCEALTTHLKGSAYILVTDYIYAAESLGRVNTTAVVDVMLVQYGRLMCGAVEQVKALCPTARIVVMDVDHHSIDAVQCLRLGIPGFLSRDASATDVLDGIRAVVAGRRLLPRSVIDRACVQLRSGAEARPDVWMNMAELSLRERQLVPLLLQGLSNKEIATRMAVSTFTVKSHVHNILNKLRIRKRVDLLNYIRSRESLGNRSPIPQRDDGIDRIGVDYSTSIRGPHDGDKHLWLGGDH
jgi:two-component system, NarL family, nitrate/nitrite response regulator NarL